MSWFDQPIPSAAIRGAMRGRRAEPGAASMDQGLAIQDWIQSLLTAINSGGGISLSGLGGGPGAGLGGGMGVPTGTDQSPIAGPGPAMAQAAPESLLAGPPAPPGMAGTPPVGPPPAGMPGAAPDSVVPSAGGGNPLEALRQAAGGLFGGGGNDLGLRDAFARAPGSYERATAYKGSTPEEQRASGLGKPRNPLNDPVGGGDYFKPLPGGTSSLLDPTTGTVPGAPLVKPSTSLVPTGITSPTRVAGGGLTGAGLGGSSLADALSGRIGSEGILAEYMADPKFAVTDILADAGMNPDRNKYSGYVAGKWGPVLGDFATLASMLDPSYMPGEDGAPGEGATGNAWANFVQQWAGGGGDPMSVLRSAVQAAQTNTPQGQALQEVLGGMEPGRLSAMISTARGEAPMAASARARMAERGALAARRAAQDRAAQGNMDPDTKEWLQYMLGAVR